MTLAAFLKQTREERGMLASQLADAAGLTRSHVSEIERGKIALPNADIRRRLANQPYPFRHAVLLSILKVTDSTPLPPALKDDGRIEHVF